MIINLPRQLTPSELLCCVELSPFINDLLQRSRALRRRSAFKEAESYARDALREGREPGGNIGTGAARMHLADVYREMGRLGPALADSQKAYRIFQNQPSPYQRHNEAMAAYALGLVHQLLGSHMDALSWYEEARLLIERVKEHWETLNAQDRIRDCACIHSWLGTLSGYLTAAWTHIGTSGDSFCVSVLLSNADRCEFAIGELEIDQYIIREREAEAGMFGVRPIKGKESIFLKPDAACSTKKIIDEKWLEFLGAREGDYALIAWKDPAETKPLDIPEALSGSEEYGPFVRGDDGEVYFVRPTPKVIGGEERDRNLQEGNVIALLSPAPPPSGPAPPSSPGPSTPPPSGPFAASRPGPSAPPLDLSAEAAALYGKLVGLVGGDRAAADRLIELERKLDPDAGRTELISRAIAHLTRDRQ